ncbi:hypothetical protein GCM10010136_17180 [Limoniibacter endophyticus]|uniref:Uncharacterized protein n=1 Tax=Limoniibacter endophyticus TaxID=1565040 RepID=A0A8J3DGZ6_9HYPH|nr:hypothetical protein GCM10010136_17180 [Limoniibacter endophyticus]
MRSPPPRAAWFCLAIGIVSATGAGSLSPDLQPVTANPVCTLTLGTAVGPKRREPA